MAEGVARAESARLELEAKTAKAAADLLTKSEQNARVRLDEARQRVEQLRKTMQDAPAKLADEFARRQEGDKAVAERKPPPPPPLPQHPPPPPPPQQQGGTTTSKRYHV